MSHVIFGVEKSIFGQKKIENVIGPSYFTVKLSVYKTTSDTFRTIWAFKTRELVMNDCFAIQRYRALSIFILFMYRIMYAWSAFADIMH